MKSLMMLGAAIIATGSAVAAPAPAAAEASPATPAPAAVPAPPAEYPDIELERARAASRAAAAAAVEAGRVAGEAGRTAGEAGKLEARLEAARLRLAADANEVAQLSMQMGKPLMERFQTRFEGAPHALIGAEIAAENGADGVRVLHVSPGGPAFEAGVRSGDLIVAVNGTDAKGNGGASRIVRVIQEAAPNAKLNVRVLHRGKPQDFVMVARPISNQFFTTADPNGQPLLPPGFADSPVFTFRELGIPSLSNMQLMTLTPGLGRYFGTDKGVLVVRAPTRSDFKLQDGDVILSIDGREPTSGAHATRILASYQAGEKVTLHIMRDRKPLSLETTLPDQNWSYRQFQAPRLRDGNE